MHQKQVIYLWIDFISPFSYLAYNNLWKAIHELKRSDLIVDLKSYQIDPDFSTDAESHMREMKHKMKIEKKIVEGDKFAGIVKNSGLRFNYRELKPINTINPHRMLQLAKTYDDTYQVANDLVKLLFLNYWSKNRDISLEKQLIPIAISVGLEENAIHAVFETNKYLEMVFLDEQEGNDAKLIGVPFLIFPNGERITGAMSVEDLKKMISQIPVTKKTETL